MTGKMNTTTEHQMPTTNHPEDFTANTRRASNESNSEEEVKYSSILLSKKDLLQWCHGKN